MKNFYIIRHGQSQTNAGGDAMINAQIPLTELGQQQAIAVADWVLATTKGKIDSIGVSRYIRTQQTAQPLLDKTDMQATLIEDLQEFNQLSFLRVEGKPVAERLAMLADYWQNKTPDYVDGAEFDPAENSAEKQAESFLTFANRAKKVLAHFHSMDEGTHIIYGHGMLISMLLWRMLDQPIDTKKAMSNFHSFELSIRPKNTEVFLLQIANGDALPAITKVRTLG